MASPASSERSARADDTSIAVTAALRVALGEYDTGWHDPEESLARAASIVQHAAAQGARLVVLPEMCTTGFTMDAARADALDGPGVQGLARLAATARVYLVAGVALREPESSGDRPVNAALLFGPSGDVRAVYRKQRVFAFAGEHDVYAPGVAPVVSEVEGVRVALFVCYDLRFPELFRAVARDVDLMVVIANWPAARRAHWDVLLRARAIENQCCVVGVNRTGEGGGVAYDGGSAGFGPWGEPLQSQGTSPRCVDLSNDAVAAVRREYPFLDDLSP
jgi:predicted amidohydrolase